MNKKDEQKLARAKVGSVVPLSNGMEIAVYNAYATQSSCNLCALKHYCINNEKSKEREKLRLMHLCFGHLRKDKTSVVFSFHKP